MSGAINRVPATASLFLAGFFAITGSPPFGLFLSELTVVRAAFHADSCWAAGLLLGLLAVVFIGMGAVVVRVVQGPSTAAHEREAPSTIVPAMCCLAVVLVLGIYIPGWLDSTLRAAANFVEMRP